MDKKYTLALFAIFKNESHIIREWIEHYLGEGVEHFWLIDNGSTDDYEEQIKPYMDKITLFKDSTKYSQSPLYNKYILPEIHKTEWVIGCDLDEFMWSTRGTIKDRLREIEDNVGLIQVPWEQYGSSGHISQPEKVVPSFLYRRGGSYTSEQKCIGRGEAITELNVHFFELKEGYITVNSLFKPHEKGFYTEVSEYILKNAKIRLAHYQIQSYDWYTRVKSTRGDVAFQTSENSRDDSYFKSRDTNDVFDDNLFRKVEYFTSSEKENNDVDKKFSSWNQVLFLLFVVLFLSFFFKKRYLVVIVLIIILLVIIFKQPKREFMAVKSEGVLLNNVVVIRAVNPEDPRVKETLSGTTKAESRVILDTTNRDTKTSFSGVFTHTEDSCRSANPLHKEIKYSLDSVLWHVYENVKDLDFKYLWLLEDDVYCDGSLDQVIEKNSSNKKDFLASFVEDYGASAEELNWMWWDSLEGQEVPEKSERVKSFFPVTRYSKEFLREIHDSIGNYSGYCEVYIPTLAKQKGFTYGNLEESSVGNLSLFPINPLPKNGDGRLYHKWAKNYF